MANDSNHRADGAKGDEGVIAAAWSDEYEVMMKDERRRCRLSGALRGRGEQAVVGDRVVIDERGVIVEVLARRTRLSRRGVGRRPREQVIVANVDQMLAVFAAASPKPRWRMLDRYLVIAEMAGIAPVICVTKIDLVGADAVRRELSHYEAIGYRLRLVCAASGQGLEGLREVLHDQTTVLVGKSGVGKTTLLNALVPGAGQRVGEVSGRTGKGRHVTSASRMHALPGGGRLIDTPGVRELGLWQDGDVSLDACFPEMREHVAACRFSPRCSHTHEPGCAVKAAVERGGIDPRRYESYLRLRGDDASPAAAPAPVRQTEDEGFVCCHCGWRVARDAQGTRNRNHCPQCLWSRHLDVQPGDRAAACGGAMKPVAVSARDDGEWSIVHRCEQCGAVRLNRIAGDDNTMSLMSLAAKALARPPFPLEMVV